MNNQGISQKDYLSSNQPQEPLENQNKGWQAPNDKPYVALGDFQNVIAVVEGLKSQIPHSKEMTAETQKMISKVKRSQNPLFKNGKPDRTLKILSKIPENQQTNKTSNKQINISGNFIDLKGIGEQDSTSIMKKMKALEEQFLASAANFHDQQRQNNQKSILVNQQSESSQMINQESHISNQRLITPALKKLMNAKDASVLLKDEILESQLRLKAAKYGHKLDEIAPAYDHSFYLPDKTLYFDKPGSQMRNSNSVNNRQSARMNMQQNSSQNKSFHSKMNIQTNNSTTYNQKNLANEYSAAFMTEPVNTMYNSQQNHEGSQQNIQDFIKSRVGINRGNQNRNDRSQRENSTMYDSYNKRNNKSFYSQNRRDGDDQQNSSTFYNKAFKTYDGISKLSPRKPKKLNELTTKYKENFLKVNETQDDGEGRRYQSQSHKGRLPNLNQSTYDSKPFNSNSRQKLLNHEGDAQPIRFVSMIDSKPVFPSYLNLIPLKQFQKKETELGRIITKDQSQNQQGDPLDPNSSNPSQFNWGKMLNEDLDDMLKQKMSKLYQDVMQKKLADSLKRRTLGFSETKETNHLQFSNLDGHHNQDHENQLSKIQAMLLGKLISFESLDTFNAEDLMKKLYNFFFNWQKEMSQDDGSQTNKNFDLESDTKGRGGTLSDDQEEKRKRLQLKLDQELIEFEERGGFAKVLKDIFNPTDYNSMELDSVFQLKALCKTFYEKKERLSANLVQTLDALSNERPKTLIMKKKNLNLDLKNGNLYDDIEWMRINAEKQRIQQYRDIAKDCAFLYYKVLKRFVEENQIYEKEKAQEKNNLLDPQIKMKQIQKEQILRDVLSYVTDYMRAVIENGNKFTKVHLFMMLKELNYEHIDFQLGKYIRILVQELDVNGQEFEDFLNSLGNDRLGEAYYNIVELQKGLQRVNHDEVQNSSKTNGRKNSSLSSSTQNKHQKQKEKQKSRIHDETRGSDKQIVDELKQSYQSIEQDSEVFMNRKDGRQIKSQIQQFNSFSKKNDLKNDLNNQINYEKNSLISDQQILSAVSSTLNTELQNDFKKKQSQDSGQTHQDNTKTSRAKEIDKNKCKTTNITGIDDKKMSIQSSRSQQALDSQYKSNQNSKRKYQEEDYINEDSHLALSPDVKSLKVSQKKSEMQNQGKEQHMRILSNISPIKTLGQNNIFTPEKYDKQVMSARPLNYSKTILKSDKQGDTLDDFKDSEEDRMRNQPQEMIKGQRSAFKNHRESDSKNKNMFSLLISDSSIQNTSLVQSKNKAQYQRSPQSAVGKLLGSRFGNLFKLQKKTLQDDGLAAFDDGLNISNEKVQQQAQPSEQTEPQPNTPDDSDSPLSGSKYLKKEYNQLKQQLSQLKTNEQMKKSKSPSPRMMRKKSTTRAVAKQNEDKIRQRLDSTRQNNEQSRLLNKNQIRTTVKSQKSNSPLNKNLKKKSKQNIISYDENSFERELIEKLNEESSIPDGSSEQSQKYNKSYKSHKTHKSKRRKSKFNSNNKSRVSHMQKKSNKIEQKYYSSSESCSTCNNRESGSQSQSSDDEAHRRNHQSKHRSPNKSKLIQQVKNKKKRKKTQERNYTQNQPFIMPIAPQMLTPQQYNIFGYPAPGIPPNTTQIMNFQNNYSFPAQPLPYFIQQQQYYNMIFQSLQAQQKVYEQKQQVQSTQPASQDSPGKSESSEKRLEQENDLIGKNNNFQTFNQSNDVNAFSLNAQTLTNPKSTFVSSNLAKPHSQIDLPVNQLRSHSNIREQEYGSNQQMKGYLVTQNDNHETDGLKQGFTFAKQLTVPHDYEGSSTHRLGSPKNNYSRLDTQFNGFTQENNQTSVNSHRDPVFTRNNHESIENQVKEANQMYLNKLKSKFQAASTQNQGPFINTASQYDQKHDAQMNDNVFSPLLSSRNSQINYHTGSMPIDGSSKERKTLVKNQSPSRTQLHSHFNHNKQIQDQQRNLIIQNQNQFSAKRLSSQPDGFDQTHNYKNQQINRIIVERLGSNERNRSVQSREPRRFDQNKSVDIQNKLKMLNQKLSQNRNLATEPILSDRKSSQKDNTPSSPGIFKEDNSPKNHRKNSDIDFPKQLGHINEDYEDIKKGIEIEESIETQSQMRPMDQIEFKPRRQEEGEQIKQALDAVGFKNNQGSSLSHNLKMRKATMQTQTVSTPRRASTIKMLGNESQPASSIRSSMVFLEESSNASVINQSKSKLNSSSKDQSRMIINNKSIVQVKKLEINTDKKIIDMDKISKLRTPKREKDDVFVEIFDHSKREQSQDPNKSQFDNQSNNQATLQDMFKQKLQSKTLNLDKRNQEKNNDQTVQQKEQPKEKERSKKEILEQRKRMMKSTVREKKDNFVNEQSKDSAKLEKVPLELMQRLAKGQKAQIDVKEMKKLSSKNYENLPEIKKKKEEERKKEEYKQRQQQVKKYAEEVEKKRKQIFHKKHAAENSNQE